MYKNEKSITIMQVLIFYDYMQVLILLYFANI